MRVCVVGVGALGRHHARILGGLPNVELVAVADPNEEQGRAVAEACGCDWTPDYRTLLSKVDAASVVVPTSFHLAVAGEFLRAGVPVLVEKPLAGNVTDGTKLVELASEKNLTLQVGHIERFNPAFECLQQNCGSVKYIRAERTSPYPFRSTDIGVVHDLMIHDIELVLELVGELPTSVEAFGVSLVGGHEDSVQARIKFPGGCVADITANRVCPTVSRQLQVWSDQGCAVADLQQRKVSVFSPGSPLKAGLLPFYLAQVPGADIPQLKADVFGQFIQHQEFDGGESDALTAELSEFVNAVSGTAAPRVSGNRGLEALQVAEHVVECVRSHQWDGTADGRVGPMALLENVVESRDYSRRAA
ncbi:MAG: Gfo/Idh/MocA family oxidoreductase [Planctomycetaceae bacterium]|nr:Gfo/Idh/MocA family oxidoreductase [Planctomycetaceae bacterium]